MKKRTLVTILLVMVMLWAIGSICYKEGKKSGYTEGFGQGIENIKENMMVEVSTFGVTHLDLLPYGRIYLVPVNMDPAMVRELVMKYF